MNITVTGNLGSGKSTVCKELEARGFKYISTGDIFRNIAMEQGLSVVELNQRVNEETAQGKHDIDDMIDKRSEQLGLEYSNAVFDSRMAWNFVKESFKVFLTVDIDEAAKRVLEAGRASEQYSSIQECCDSLLKRQLLEQERFKELYKVDYYDMSNFNLIIETTSASPKVIADKILEEYEKYKEQSYSQKVFLNPSSLYPTQHVRDISEDALNKYLEDESGKTYAAISAAGNDNEWYVLDGHDRWIGALRNNHPFIEALIEQKSIQKPEKETLDAYEEVGGFRYKKYPSQQKKEQLLRFSEETGEASAFL